MSEDRFVLVDIETTGLEYMTDLVLEVGFTITDANLEVVDIFDLPIWESPTYDRVYDSMKRAYEIVQAGGSTDKTLQMQAFVFEMHESSGLWTDCREEGRNHADAEAELVAWLKGYGVSPKSDPMVGSSVHFDRGFLKEHFPEIDGQFLHRNVDVSTLKELCRRMNPAVYGKLETMVPKRAKHRVIEDIEDTIGEFRFYRDNFLYLA